MWCISSIFTIYLTSCLSFIVSRSNARRVQHRQEVRTLPESASYVDWFLNIRIPRKYLQTGSGHQQARISFVLSVCPSLFYAVIHDEYQCQARRSANQNTSLDIRTPQRHLRVNSEGVELVCTNLNICLTPCLPITGSDPSFYSRCAPISFDKEFDTRESSPACPVNTRIPRVYLWIILIKIIRKSEENRAT